jgi:ubiquinone/menaquinone biosynthesis C-methylase UbiE
MVCHGGFFLEESVRRAWYNPAEILKTAGLCSGMVFMDIGCGDGFFSLLAAETVGEAGKVYAVDMDGLAIEKLNRKAKVQGLKNVHAMVGAAEETVFCSHCADLVFYSMVLHDFKDPVKGMCNAKQMLKSTGKLVNLDWKKTLMPFGPPVHIRFSEQDAQTLIEKAGFTLENVKDAGPYHYIITAKP